MTNIPTHIGIIMDGNRRWAKQRKLNPIKGHDAGMETLHKITWHAIKKEVKFLTVYAFSTENWQRTQGEVGHLMKLVIEAYKRYLDEFDKAGVRLIMLGNPKGVDKKVLSTIKAAEKRTVNNTKMTVSVCFNYGGQLEIADAVKKIVKKGIKPADINEQTVTDNLYHPEVPPVDIIVRTSGELRLSNFMLWRAAYSELMFIDKHWPDFNEADLDKVIDEYNHRQRRFGA